MFYWNQTINNMSVYIMFRMDSKALRPILMIISKKLQGNWIFGLCVKGRGKSRFLLYTANDITKKSGFLVCVFNWQYLFLLFLFYLFLLYSEVPKYYTWNTSSMMLMRRKLGALVSEYVGVSWDASTAFIRIILNVIISDCYCILSKVQLQSSP